MVRIKLGVSQSSQLELSISVCPFFNISLFIIGEKDDFVKRFLLRFKLQLGNNIIIRVWKFEGYDSFG